MSSPHNQDEIGRKIKHLLRIYPVISPTMLQAGLGPAVKPIFWREVLEEMIADGGVLREYDNSQNIEGRSNTYTKLLLPGTEVIIHDDINDANSNNGSSKVITGTSRSKDTTGNTSRTSGV